MLQFVAPLALPELVVQLPFVPELLHLVAVGKVSGASKTGALIVMVKEDLTLLAMKMWSFTGDAPAT